MMSTTSWIRFLAVSLLLRCTASATSPQALSVTPSTTWYGDDGTWSAISIRVGTPPQWLDVMVSTISSETWVIGPYGCNNNTICINQRGGIFDLTQSSSWAPEGYFDLGVDQQLQVADASPLYAEYGLDDLTFGTTGVTLQNAVIGSINTTEYWNGMFGLGIVPGNFTNVTPLSAISALVEKDAVIPSHSYGFTAGARYQQKGETVSLTLGGYDENRFIPNNLTFTLNPSQNPQIYIDSVYIYSTSSTNNWTTPVQVLNTADRVSAIIDSTTPYLWFPEAVCDRFADSLGLTYNESLNTYTFDGNPAQHEVLGNAQITFTFSLANDGFADDQIAIVVPYEAFDLQLTFPAIPGTNYGEVNSSAYYFPLKRATNEAQYTIGRAFLQEAYLITDYERNTFSVHQAVHVSDPIGNTSLVSILRPSDSKLSAPLATKTKFLSTGAIVGIAIGVAVVVTLLCFAIFVIYRRRRRHDHGSGPSSENPSSPPRKFFGRFRRRRQLTVHEVEGNISYPTEVGADSSHERFELPAPLGPAELDSDSGTLYGSTVHGPEEYTARDLSAYERARRKLERQQHPASTTSAATSDMYPVEKSDNDVSSEPHHRTEMTIPDIETPLVSPLGGEGSRGSMANSNLPSPVSPAFGPRAETSALSPPPTYRKVEPANVVYAGRLPDDVQLPCNVPRNIGPDGNIIRAEQTIETETDSTYNTSSTVGASSLGSMHTETENTRNPYNSHNDMYGNGSERGASAVEVALGRARREEDESKFLREDIQAMRADIQTREILDTVKANSRPMDGEDLVHVPQPADRRFSFEDERLEGTE